MSITSEITGESPEAILDALPSKIRVGLACGYKGTALQLTEPVARELVRRIEAGARVGQRIAEADARLAEADRKLVEAETARLLTAKTARHARLWAGTAVAILGINMVLTLGGLL